MKKEPSKRYSQAFKQQVVREYEDGMPALHLDDILLMPAAVSVPGPGFRGPSDYPLMAAVIDGGKEAENISGALRLNQSMGFQVVKQHTTYRKPL